MSGPALAERFGMSLRTIYRDLRTLELVGVPLLGEAGVGYSLAEGYRVPPVLFTREEATALQNGAWALLDEVEALCPPVASFFGSLSRTDKRNMLPWLASAKRPATRQQRCAEIMAQAARQLTPAQFQSCPRPH